MFYQIYSFILLIYIYIYIYIYIFFCYLLYCLLYCLLNCLLNCLLYQQVRGGCSTHMAFVCAFGDLLGCFGLDSFSVVSFSGFVLQTGANRANRSQQVPRGANRSQCLFVHLVFMIYYLFTYIAAYWIANWIAYWIAYCYCPLALDPG